MNQEQNLQLINLDKKSTIQNVLVSSAQRTNLLDNTNSSYIIKLDTKINIFGYRINNLTFRKNYDLCNFQMLVQQVGQSDKNISFSGSFSSSEFCSKLQQELINKTVNFTSCSVSYDETNGKITISGYPSAFLLAGDITLTIVNKKSSYYIGNHIVSSQSFVFPAGSVVVSKTMAGIANFTSFPPNFYLLSMNLAQGSNVYNTNCVAVLTDKKIVETDDKFHWITIKNQCLDFKYIKESQLNEIDISIAVEDLDNLGNLALLDFKYGDISLDIDLL